MSGIHFQARKWAGSFPLTRHDGETKEIHIRVMDTALYSEFREYETKVQEEAAKIDKDDILAKAKFGNMSMDLSREQLFILCPDLTQDDLIGFDLVQVREMFQYATKMAYGLERADEEKKNQSNTGSKRSGSRKRAGTSKQQQAAG